MVGCAQQGCGKSKSKYFPKIKIIFLELNANQNQNHFFENKNHFQKSKSFFGAQRKSKSKSTFRKSKSFSKNQNHFKLPGKFRWIRKQNVYHTDKPSLKCTQNQTKNPAQYYDEHNSFLLSCW